MFDPKEFISFAQRLAVSPHMADVDIRNCLSRAYYGAYLMARQRASAAGRFRPTFQGDDHALLIGRLSSAPEDELVHVADLLRLLRADRNKADYDLTWSPTRAQARLAVALAADVVRSLDRLFPPPQP